VLSDSCRCAPLRTQGARGRRWSQLTSPLAAQCLGARRSFVEKLDAGRRTLPSVRPRRDQGPKSGCHSKREPDLRPILLARSEPHACCGRPELVTVNDVTRWLIAFAVGTVVAMPALAFGIVHLVSPATTLRWQMEATDRARGARRAVALGFQGWLGIGRSPDPINDPQVLRRVRIVGAVEVVCFPLLFVFAAAVVASVR
jgi:hypothetical protein